MVLSGEITEHVNSRTKYNWEAGFVQGLQDLIRTDDKVHGLDHCLSVVERVYQLQSEPEFQSLPPDGEILTASGYLHDLGYASDGHFSPDTFEHLEYGQKYARELLQTLDGFDHLKISGVLYLIGNHDNAKFSQRNFHLGDKPRLTRRQVILREQTGDRRLKTALAILKEADSQEYTDIKGTQRTYEYCQVRGFPLTIDGEGPSPHHSLNRCTLSNLLLFPHLAWSNATSGKGKLAAVRGYIAAEKWVYDFCQDHKLAYFPDYRMPEIIWASSNTPGLLPKHINHIVSVR